MHSLFSDGTATRWTIRALLTSKGVLGCNIDWLPVDGFGLCFLYHYPYHGTFSFIILILIVAVLLLFFINRHCYEARYNTCHYTLDA